ncbi:hypothetical protein [Micromonospora yangpuensis]|uniref:Uncharacterized protein n=1 Tax=Micromonospora yangpuensis TaxID=683228 RepID=A0A1C6U4A8_9ACTN|nr:hypothetical protein [Micromonospora yangpuensis]GGL93052.1 hypothetical protein GCM10012279_08490 [Micromonospora yangpuensis]SCL48751.1 hypothetical protein GA0070617_0968 [Micromonospora yangpuensis]
MAKKPAPAATPAAAPSPEAVIRTMIVCVSEDLSAVLDSSRHLERHLGVAGVSCPRYWASPALRLWQHRQLIGLRKATAGPRYCAGGPIRLLDLAGMRHGAHVGASVRHANWAGVVAGTKSATAWSVFRQRHLADPTGYPMDTAVAEFHRQPRVQAMRIHNAALHGPGRLDLDELEMFQAGSHAYATYHALWAVCTDAFLTTTGDRMQPASGFLTDRITYLDRAARYLDSLDDSQRLFAVNPRQP